MMTSANQDDSAATGCTTLESRLPPGRSNRARSWVSAALVFLVFVAGAVCGAAVMEVFDDSDRPENWDGVLEEVAQEMQRELDLTEAQYLEIEKVVRVHQPRLDQIHARNVKDMRAELQQVIEEMSAALTPDQEKEFREEAQPRLDELFPPEAAKPAVEAKP